MSATARLELLVHPEIKARIQAGLRETLHPFIASRGGTALVEDAPITVLVGRR